MDSENENRKDDTHSTTCFSVFPFFILQKKKRNMYNRSYFYFSFFVRGLRKKKRIPRYPFPIFYYEIEKRKTKGRYIHGPFQRPSHHGGSWKHLIPSSRRIMVGLLKEHALSDDGRATLLAEVEAILNGGPLTRCSSDPHDLVCLTLNHLLLLKSDQAVPPGKLIESDNYVRRRWRQVQYLSDQFWKRWVRDYLVLLQDHQKCFFPSGNV